MKVVSNYGNAFLYPTLTSVDYQYNTANNRIGKVKFQLLGDFFEEDNPRDLEVTGSVKLQLKGSRRHLSLEDTARVLASNDEAKFNLEVGLGAENDSGAWENSGNIASSAILTTILGGVYTMW